MPEKIVWIKEQEAAEMLGYKPETLRKLVKSGKLNIAFTCLNNRKFLYCKNNIERELLAHSNYVK
jgi:predicted site-specific integrase-resolvase